MEVNVIKITSRITTNVNVSVKKNIIYVKKDYIYNLAKCSVKNV